MKKLIILMTMIAIIVNGCSQSSKNNVCDSTLNVITKQLDSIKFRINGINRFKLYPTENIYTLLKLDTATGKINQ